MDVVAQGIFMTFGIAFMLIVIVAPIKIIMWVVRTLKKSANATFNAVPHRR